MFVRIVFVVAAKMNGQVGHIGQLQRMNLQNVKFIHRKTPGFRLCYESRVVQLYAIENSFRQEPHLAQLVERLGNVNNPLCRLNIVMFCPQRLTHESRNIIHRDNYGSNKHYFVRLIAGPSFQNQKEIHRVLHTFAQVSGNHH